MVCDWFVSFTDDSEHLINNLDTAMILLVNIIITIVYAGLIYVAYKIAKNKHNKW